MKKQVATDITYVGVDDVEIDLFESQYIVPQGMCYNSYLIEDEKIAIMDSVDARKFDEWKANLTEALKGRKPDYLVVQHMEPDHSGSIGKIIECYPEMKIVCSGMAQTYLKRFFDGIDFSERVIVVAEGDNLELGHHTLTFYTAPMVHWPEVIVTYDKTSKILFSADGFGKFGTIDADPDDWACEARRYYFNICGKYGIQVQNLLAKAQTLDINTVCPLHGPILSGDKLTEALRLYDIWSRYAVETRGVLIAHASIHGGTAAAAKKMAELLEARNVGKVVVTDLCRDDMAEAIEDAFRMGSMIVAASTYDADVFPPMYMFLHKLQLKGYKNRRVGIIQNGTWAPQSGKIMRAMLEAMKDVEIVEPMCTIRSRMKAEDMPSFEALANAMAEEKIAN